MPAVLRDAPRRVAHQIAVAELLEDAQERRARFAVFSISNSRPPVNDVRSRRNSGFSRDTRRHAVDDDVGALRGVEHRVGAQPARGVDAVAEDDQQAAAGVGLADHDAGVGAVDQRGLAGAVRVVERLTHRATSVVSFAPSVHRWLNVTSAA